MTITTTLQAAHTTGGHQAVRIPAIAAAGIGLAFAGLQVTLEAGAPSACRWGGAHVSERAIPHPGRFSRIPMHPYPYLQRNSD